LKKYPNIDIVHVNVSDNKNNQQINGFLELVQYPKEKVSSKKRPTVFIRADDRISLMDVSCINEQYNQKFNTALQKESSYYTAATIKDLTDYIQKFNKSLNDTTIVYCNDSDTWNTESTKAAFRLMR
jgi:hypothetical protein